MAGNFHQKIKYLFNRFAPLAVIGSLALPLAPADTANARPQESFETQNNYGGLEFARFGSAPTQIAVLEEYKMPHDQRRYSIVRAKAEAKKASSVASYFTFGNYKKPDDNAVCPLIREKDVRIEYDFHMTVKRNGKRYGWVAEVWTDLGEKTDAIVEATADYGCALMDQDNDREDTFEIVKNPPPPPYRQ